MYKNGHKTRKVKHCVHYTFLYIVNCNIQRYKCKECNFVFYEFIDFCNLNENISKESLFAILDNLKHLNETFESTASTFHLSRQTVINIFDKYVDYYPPKELPLILCFDEKHINNSITKNSYLFVITDFLNNKIYDILHSRHKNTLSKYFSTIPYQIRYKVQYITIDMWETYLDVASIYFKNAKIAIDSFHVMKLVNNAMQAIRISVMQKYNNNAEDINNNHDYYYMLKKFKYFFLSEFDDLSNEFIYINKFRYRMNKHQILKYLLDIDPKLSKAYYLTRKYREFNKTANIMNCANELESLIEEFLSSDIKGFIDVARTIAYWKEYIINSFIIIEQTNSDGTIIKRRLSNGPAEGINSKLEIININGYGFSNFNRYKNKCIYSINKDVAIKN